MLDQTPTRKIPGKRLIDLSFADDSSSCTTVGVVAFGTKDPLTVITDLECDRSDISHASSISDDISRSVSSLISNRSGIPSAISGNCDRRATFNHSIAASNIVDRLESLHHHLHRNHPPASAPQHRKRRVRFSMRVDSRSLPPLDPDVSVAELYWTAQDFATIRMAAKLDTRNLRAHCQEGIANIDRAFTSSFLLVSSNHHDNDDDATAVATTTAGVDAAAMMLQENPSRYVNVDDLSRMWCSRSQLCGRGLERYVSTKHRQERGEYGSSVRALLLKESREGGLSPDALAQMYANASLPGAVFARFMGAADEIAARGVEEEEVQTAAAYATGALDKPENTLASPSSSRSRPLLQRQKSFDPAATTLGAALARDNSRRRLLAGNNHILRREGSERTIVMAS